MKDNIILKTRFWLFQAACLILFLLAAQGWAKENELSVSRVDPSMDKRVQEALDKAVTEYNVPGAILALGDMNGNTRIWANGLAELETEKPMTSDLYFMIGSATKTYTATMVLQLVDDGLIKLDEPIGKYLPGLVPRENEITIRLLLGMRSGLGDYGPNPEFEKFMETNPLQACTPEQLVKFSLDKTGEPDKEFHYTNTNYILLGMLIEKVTDNSFSDEMQRRILQPLGMSHTFMLTEMKMPTPYANGYRYEEGKVVDGTYSIHPSLFWTAGGIVSTAADQLIWAKALLEGRLLSPQAHSEQFTMKPASSQLGFYGLGVMNMNGLIGHGGNYNNLYTSFIGRYHGYDCVILVNGQTGDAEEKTFRAKAILQKVIKERGL